MNINREEYKPDNTQQQNVGLEKQNVTRPKPLLTVT